MSEKLGIVIDKKRYRTWVFLFITFGLWFYFVYKIKTQISCKNPHTSTNVAEKCSTLIDMIWNTDATVIWNGKECSLCSVTDIFCALCPQIN